MRLTAAVATLVLALAVAGCGDEEPSSGAKPTTGPAPAQATTSDKARANAARLVLADFPAGWTQASVGQKDPADPDCPQIDAAKKATSARGRAPDFQEGRNTKAQSVVYAYAAEAAATSAFARLSEAGLRSCLGRVTAAVVEQVPDVDAGDPSVVPLEVPAVGGGRLAFRLSIPLRAKRVRAVLNQDIVLIRSGRGISIVTFLTQAAPVTAELRDQLTRVAADRLQASFGK